MLDRPKWREANQCWEWAETNPREDPSRFAPSWRGVSTVSAQDRNPQSTGWDWESCQIQRGTTDNEQTRAFPFHLECRYSLEQSRLILKCSQYLLGNLLFTISSFSSTLALAYIIQVLCIWIQDDTTRIIQGSNKSIIRDRNGTTLTFPRSQRVDRLLKDVRSENAGLHNKQCYFVSLESLSLSIYPSGLKKYPGLSDKNW